MKLPIFRRLYVTESAHFLERLRHVGRDATNISKNLEISR